LSHNLSSNPPGNNANGAVYKFEPKVVKEIASITKEYLDISTDILPNDTGRIFSWPADGLHKNIGTPANLMKANN
jgi:mannose-1-phosphate guanylyltransferase